MHHIHRRSRREARHDVPLDVHSVQLLRGVHDTGLGFTMQCRKNVDGLISSTAPLPQ